MAGFQGDQDFTNQGAGVGHPLSFRLNNIDGDISGADVVILGNVVVKSDQHFKACIFGFGEQFPVFRACPAQKDDVCAFVANEVFDQGNWKIFVQQQPKISL
jgi:hypothetical protein